MVYQCDYRLLEKCARILIDFLKHFGLLEKKYLWIPPNISKTRNSRIKSQFCNLKMILCIFTLKSTIVDQSRSLQINDSLIEITCVIIWIFRIQASQGDDCDLKRSQKSIPLPRNEVLFKIELLNYFLWISALSCSCCALDLYKNQCLCIIFILWASMVNLILCFKSTLFFISNQKQKKYNFIRNRAAGQKFRTLCTSTASLRIKLAVHIKILPKIWAKQIESDLNIHVFNYFNMFLWM